MASEFLGNVLCRCRMPRQIGKHCTALIDAGVGVMLAEHHLLARLMQTSHEDEFAAMNEEWLKWFPTNPPARQGAKLPLRVEGLKISIAVIAQA